MRVYGSGQPWTCACGNSDAVRTSVITGKAMHVGVGVGVGVSNNQLERMPRVPVWGQPAFVPW